MLVEEKFSDVFTEELPGLPPVREVEFVIETIQGTKLISKRPYQMSRKELEVVKNQIEEYQEKGLIRPSTSP